MLKALIGKKLNMSQVFDTHGRVTPVTRLKMEPNIIVSLREKDRDGYKSAQIGIGSRKKVSQPLKGHFAKAKLTKFPAILKEVDFDGELKVGQEINFDEVFHKGSLVDVVGRSKGKGFAGVVKRYGFHGGPKTHGQSDRHRAPGSIGSGTTPGRVQKGMKMPGHMGSDQVSIFGLEIIQIDKEDNILVVKGSVPGATGTTILIKKSKKKKTAYHEPEIQALPNLGGGDQEDKSEDQKAEVEDNKNQETEVTKTEKEETQNGKEN